MSAKARHRMIETTSRLLREHGYYGTSLNDILAGSGAPRGSLYFHFPGGKNQIVIEATRISVAEATAALRQGLAQAPSPGQGVRGFFEVTARMMEESGYTFGCPVAPIVLDAHAGDDALAELCRAAFDEWTGLIRDAFVEAGMDAARAETLALMVEATHEGLFLICRTRRDVSPLIEVGAMLEKVVDGNLPQGTRALGDDRGRG